MPLHIDLVVTVELNADRYVHYYFIDYLLYI